jgi:agmatinase
VRQEDAGAFPIVIGGDHSIGFPDTRAIAKHVEGNLESSTATGILTPPKTIMDERMHTTHWSDATNLPDVPATNLVHIGIGGCIGNHSGVKGGQGTRYHRDHDIRC